jgi:hypothetical protein
VRAAVIAVLLAALAAAPGAHAATVTADPERLGKKVPRSFLGLSVEWDSLDVYATRLARLERLLRPIARSQRGLALRVGGNSADASWWNPTGRRRPRIVLHDLGERDLDAAGGLATALGDGPVTLGVNLALRDPANAERLLDAARDRMPLEVVELGNEPDLYTAAKTFRVPGAVHRRLRKHRYYTPRSYGRDVARYLDVLDAPRFSVGGFARPFWWSSLPGLLNRWRGEPNVISVHMYALPYCDAPAPPASWLMTREASRVLASKLRPIAGLARKRGMSMRVTELNSAVCGGRRGISDRAYAAVWLADILFALVAEGARQADVHTWHRAVYAPFAVAPGGRVRARPPLDGMRAFAHAAPAGSRLAATRVSGGVRAWATKAPDGTVRVALIAPRPVSVSVAVPRRRCASVWMARPGGRRSTRRCAGRRARVRLPARTVAVVRMRAT